jgi:hypothetical protein
MKILNLRRIYAGRFPLTLSRSQANIPANVVLSSEVFKHGGVLPTALVVTCVAAQPSRAKITKAITTSDLAASIEKF